MSTQQVQKCLRDILGLKPDDLSQDWTSGSLKKLASATATLYQASVNKVMLKQDEETARCHICAFIAVEKLNEKHNESFNCYVDQVPMQPTKMKGLVQLFKQNIFQTSPVKKFSWTPSPKKRSKTVTKNDSFTSKHPDELRKQLFSTPTKAEPKTSSNSVTKDTDEQQKIVETPKSARRKLAFEEDLEDDETAISPVKKRSKTEKTKTLRTLADGSTEHGFLSNDDSDSYQSANEDDERISANNSSDEGDSKKKPRSSKAFSDTQKRKRSLSLLAKKHVRLNVSDVIQICNQFELPEKTALNIFAQYNKDATYLICPWQLLCGLVLTCAFVVYNKKRQNDTKIDQYLLEKMCYLMKTADVNEIFECIRIVKELVVGEKWYRDLQIQYDYFDGATYQEAIFARLGSMLQSKNILVSEEQYQNWKNKVNQDLYLRNPTK